MTQNDWLCESLRATFFTAISPQPAVRQWWETFTGFPSDKLQVTEGPVGHASASGELSEEKALLQVALQPGRIDWNYLAASKTDGGKITLANDRSFKEAVDQFLGRVERWTPMAPPHGRIALGCILRQPVEDKEEGYRVLQNYLPAIQIDPINSTDFHYRINRPRLSQVPSFQRQVNRLSNWGVVTIQFQIGTPIPTASSSIYARLEMDLSTSAESDQLFNTGLSNAIHREMQALAVEIAEKGDRP